MYFCEINLQRRIADSNVGSEETGESSQDEVFAEVELREMEVASHKEKCAPKGETCRVDGSEYAWVSESSQADFIVHGQAEIQGEIGSQVEQLFRECDARFDGDVKARSRRSGRQWTLGFMIEEKLLL